jgi:Na+-driven multidrug efflux pump
MAAAGAAISTVLSQGISVVLSVLIIKRQGLPFDFGKENIGFHKELIKRVIKLGFPIAFQEMLVSISFLVILAIVNSLGLVASAGVGVAEKLCVFIMLVRRLRTCSLCPPSQPRTLAQTRKTARIKLCFTAS